MSRSDEFSQGHSPAADRLAHIFGQCGVEHPGVGRCTREEGHELPHETENYERFQFAHERGQPGFENPPRGTQTHSPEDIAAQERMLEHEETTPHQGEDEHRSTPSVLDKIDRVLGYVRD